MLWRRRSFELLPALSVRGKHLRKGLRVVTTAWMFGIVWQATLQGSTMNLWGRMLGFTDEHFGWFQAISCLAFVGQLFSAVAIERTGLRKIPFLVYSVIGRSSWFVIAAIPLFVMPGRAAIFTFLGIYAVGCAVTHMAIPPWQNWMGDMIPRRIRGRYFANRAVLTVPLRIATFIVVGIVLDRVMVQSAGDLKSATISIGAEPHLLGTISIIFAIGAVFGIIDILLFIRMREIVSPPMASRFENGSPPGPADEHLARTDPLLRLVKSLGKWLTAPFGIVLEAMRDRKFIYFAGYGATLSLALHMAGPFFWRNALENIRYSNLGANVVFMGSVSIAGLAMVRIWGRLIDRWGRRPVLILATIGVVFSPAGWLFIPASGPAPLAEVLGGAPWLYKTLGQASWLAYLLGSLTCMLGGAMWTGIELARTSILLGFSETKGRSKYIAAAAAFFAIGGFAGGLTGGYLCKFLTERHGMAYDDAPLVVGPFLWNNWHIVFMLSAALRATSLLWLIGMPDPGAKPFGQVFRHIRGSLYNYSLPWLFGWPWRVFRRRRDSNSSRMSWPLRWLLGQRDDQDNRAA